MAKISIISFGKPKDTLFSELQDHYIRLIAHYLQIELKVLKDIGRHRVSSAGMKKFNPQETVILTETGKLYSTLDFRLYLGRLLAERKHVVFVLGNAYGFSEDVKERFKEQLSLSSLTLQHDLARIVLMEQLYRVLNLTHGGKYHK